MPPAMDEREELKIRLLPDEREKVDRVDRQTGRYRTDREIEEIARERTGELVDEILKNGFEEKYHEERELVRRGEKRWTLTPLEKEEEDGSIVYRKAYIGPHKVWSEIGKEWRTRTTMIEREKVVTPSQIERLEDVKENGGTAEEKIEGVLEATDGGWHYEELADFLGYADSTIKSSKPDDVYSVETFPRIKVYGERR
ncbi:hypothetical protein AKJ36_00040 [candidate division MSBL1 archaeon SCGC-AAA259I07]|uniref:Uncharacterized protein n=1 Tax=candidate division MSBL1 archaeon SCGC-AAA259I07 TaxID=1698266 RepID=A0A133UN77_9EURY|nr:hypothetical protein AKJ36_00040 [candidate division MSBL1 archaeon SCGC-AAA259I07]